MRRDNSSISVKFHTNAGTQLYNNDYYGSAEESKFACYVVADGIETGNGEDWSAQIAVEAIIDAFTEKPSMSRYAAYKYIQEAQKALVNNSYTSRLKASVAFIITDYQKARIVHVGNVRATIFRKARVYFETYDDSLSWDLYDQGDLTKDRIARHEERNNLTKYLGQGGKISPNISKKIKLQEGDVFSLYSRGVWENCDQFDMITSFAEADGDLKQTSDHIERVITDIKPPNFILPVGQRKRGRPPKERDLKRDVENYTYAIGFADKLYLDPNKGKRKKLILKIVIPLLIILLLLSIVLFFVFRDRRIKREEMETYYISGIEYILDENFSRAGTELDEASKLAKKLKDRVWQEEIDHHQKLVEAIVRADDLMVEGNYGDAQQAYITARDRARYTNHIGDDENSSYYLEDSSFEKYHLGRDYIDRKLEIAGNYASVHDYLQLGDQLTDQGSYEMAESKYLAARALSSQIHYANGKTEALDALERLYVLIAEEEAAKEDEALAALQSEIVAAELISQGDNAFTEGDLISAKLYYEMAKEKYRDLENDDIVQNIDERMSLLEEKETDIQSQLDMAENYQTQGDAFFDKKLYTSAKRQYLLARDIYAKSGTEEQLRSIETKMETVDTYITQEEIGSRVNSGRD